MLFELLLLIFLACIVYVLGGCCGLNVRKLTLLNYNIWLCIE